MTSLSSLLARWRAVHENATSQEWIAYRMVHADRSDDMTPDEVGEYVRNSVVKSAAESGSVEFIAIVVQKDDGPADVCHVGNGPTSPANAKAIALAHNTYAELLAVAEAAQAYRAWTKLPVPTASALLVEHVAAGDCWWQELEAALASLAEKGRET